MMSGLGQRTLARFTPPLRLPLSTWLEANVRLPEGLSAVPGPLRLWPWQKDIADAISNPLVERVSIIKSARVGFTTLLTGAIGSFVANDPAPILVLLPTEADARDYMVSDIEPVFGASPALRRSLAADRGADADRDTLTSKRFPGGSLKIVAAKSPRNLRRHTARILLIDEADAMEASAEGDPIRLGEMRTLTFANRKIIIGSTPIFEDTSAVIRAYGESDQRVFEVPCPACGAFTEIMWQHIVWPEDNPAEAAFQCPHCNEIIPERHKAQMVTAGQWRATKPEVEDHAGFRLNSLVSLLTNARWGVLAKEFLSAKSDPARLQSFTNTILGQGWSTPSMINEDELAARAEPFDLNAIPPEVLIVTAGADVQDDRVEVSIVGWTRESVALVLEHVMILGNFQGDSTWLELDELLRSRWRHPHGGQLKIDAACVDASDGDHFDKVLNFCFPRMNRRIFASKGMFGARPAFQMSKGKTIGNKLALIGVDGLKNVIFDRLQRGRGIRFSKSLEPVYYEQLASERRVVRYARGQPTRRFERVGKVRNETLDCLVYAFAARTPVKVAFDRREAELKGTAAPVTPVWKMLASLNQQSPAPPQPPSSEFRIPDRRY
jgi:phage terminase large subunit GpA-like protein